jgi:hypothetical protein
MCWRSAVFWWCMVYCWWGRYPLSCADVPVVVTVVQELQILSVGWSYICHCNVCLRNIFLNVFIWCLGKPEGKRPLGRPRRRWENNIKMDLQEVGGGFGDWMGLAQDRERWRALVSKVVNFGFHQMRGISWLAADPVSFSRRTLIHGVSSYGFLCNCNVLIFP